MLCKQRMQILSAAVSLATLAHGLTARAQSTELTGESPTATGETTTNAGSATPVTHDVVVVSQVNDPVAVQVVESDGVTQSCAQLPCGLRLATGRVHVVASGAVRGDFTAELTGGPMEISVHPRSPWGVVGAVTMMTIATVPTAFGVVFLSIVNSFGSFNGGSLAAGIPLTVSGVGLAVGGVAVLLATGPGVDVRRARVIPMVSPLPEGGAVVGVTGRF